MHARWLWDYYNLTVSAVFQVGFEMTDRELLWHGFAVGLAHHSVVLVFSHRCHPSIQCLDTVACADQLQEAEELLVWLEAESGLATLFCLFFSRPQSEGWPHHGRTFSMYLCPLSFWLRGKGKWKDWLFHGESCPRLDVVNPGRAWSASPTCTWHCSLHYLFLQATPLFLHGMTIVC